MREIYGSGNKFSGEAQAVPALNPASVCATPPLEIAGFNSLPLHFRVYLLHSWPFGANEVAVSVNPGKTGALARVLQATAQYSICGWGEYAPSTTTSWSYADVSLKAPEGKLGQAVANISREVVYP